MTPNNSEVDRAENLTATSAQAVRSGRIAARHEYWHPTGGADREANEPSGATAESLWMLVWHKGDIDGSWKPA